MSTIAPYAAKTPSPLPEILDIADSGKSQASYFCLTSNVSPAN